MFDIDESAQKKVAVANMTEILAKNVFLVDAHAGDKPVGALHFPNTPQPDYSRAFKNTLDTLGLISSDENANDFDYLWNPLQVRFTASGLQKLINHKIPHPVFDALQGRIPAALSATRQA